MQNNKIKYTDNTNGIKYKISKTKTINEIVTSLSFDNNKNTKVIPFTSISGSITTATAIKETSSRNALHPTNNKEFNRIINTKVLHDNQQDFMMSCLSNANLCVWESVGAGTKLTYQTGFRHFEEFVRLYETDIRSEIIPPSWNEHTNIYKTYFSFKESVILGYLCYLRFDGSEITPKAAFVYLSGVRFMLTAIGVDTSFIDTSIYIKRCKTGMMNMYRREDGNKECETGCLPLFWAAILSHRTFTNLHPTFLNKLKQMGLEFGFITVSRPCEIVKTPTTDHNILSEHIVFDIKTENEILKIPSCDVSSFEEDWITGATITIGLSLTKNDLEGKANTYYYEKKKRQTSSTGVPVTDDEDFYCFVRSLYASAVTNMPKKGESFFTCNTDKKKFRLTYQHYGAAVKKAAQLSGIQDTTGYTQKSTRVGAATTMAAANMPDYTIKYLGRWKSLAFMDYIRVSLGQFEQALSLLTNKDTFTLEQARQCNPRFSRLVSG